MPYITWINELFPAAQEPYLLAEITTRLQQFYLSSITEAQVNHAARELAQRQAIKPVSATRKRYRQYDHEAARKIARLAVHGRPPQRVAGLSDEALAAAKNPAKAPKKQKLALKSTLAVSNVATPLAA